MCECHHTVQHTDSLWCKVPHFVMSRKHLEDVWVMATKSK
jgi:hypothetical protein